MNDLNALFKKVWDDQEKKYTKETTRHTEKFSEMQGVITTQAQLLSDKYKSMADFADAVGTFSRATHKEPFLKSIIGRGKKEGEEIPT